MMGATEAEHIVGTALVVGSPLAVFAAVVAAIAIDRRHTVVRNLRAAEARRQARLAGRPLR